MKIKSSGFIIVIIIILALWVGSAYNGLVNKDESVKTAWSQVETSYQRRFDLIPNLVETVKGISKQEQEVFSNIAEARTKYSGAGTINEKAAAAGNLESALGRLLVIIENYPELKSSESYNNLMVQLEGTENRISVERNRYNETVQILNTSLRRFPTSIIGSIFGFEQAERFESVEGAEEAPAVTF